MNEISNFGKKSYLPIIHNRQLIPNKKKYSFNIEKQNNNESSINKRNSFTPNNKYNSKLNKIKLYEETGNSNKINKNLIRNYNIEVSNNNKDFKSNTPKNNKRAYENINDNNSQYYHIIKPNPQMFKKKKTFSSIAFNIYSSNYNSLKENTNLKTIYKQNKIKKCPLCKKTIQLNRFDYHFSNHPSQILPWLFLGNYRNAFDKEELNSLNIKYILNCAFECYNHFPNEITYCHLKINDLPNFKILPHLNKAVSFIEEAHNKGVNILIHCQMGISRSTSCLIAYFVKSLGYKVMNALRFIKRKRKQVMPNYGFLEQLVQYEKNNLPYIKKDINNGI